MTTTNTSTASPPTVPASPILPTYGITRAEYWRRTDAAEDLAEQREQESTRLSKCFGSEILWHPDFTAGFVRSISCMGLHEVEAFLSNDLANGLNGGRPLDHADYRYLFDCLREGLADNPTPLAALRLARALAWVEQAADAPLPNAQPHLTASQPEAAPALAA